LHYFSVGAFGFDVKSLMTWCFAKRVPSNPFTREAIAADDMQRLRRCARRAGWTPAHALRGKTPVEQCQLLYCELEHRLERDPEELELVCYPIHAFRIAQSILSQQLVGESIPVRANSIVEEMRHYANIWLHFLDLTPYGVQLVNTALFLGLYHSIRQAYESELEAATPYTHMYDGGGIF
jgi:hypothetical protein